MGWDAVWHMGRKKWLKTKLWIKFKCKNRLFVKKNFSPLFFYKNLELPLKKLGCIKVQIKTFNAKVKLFSPTVEMLKVFSICKFFWAWSWSFFSLLTYQIFMKRSSQYQFSRHKMLVEPIPMIFIKWGMYWCIKRVSSCFIQLVCCTQCLLGP